MQGLLTEIKIAIRGLSRNRHRTVVAIMTVAAGIIAFLLAGGFINWIFHDMAEATIRSQLGHIQVIRPGYYEKGIADPYAFLLPADTPEQRVKAVAPEVTSMSARLAFSGLASFGDVSVPFIGEGIDPQKEKAISKRITVVDGRDLKDTREKAVLLGEGLAKALGVKPGDSIVLLATAANGGTRGLEVEVAGLFATITKAYDDSALRLPLEQAKSLMRVDGASVWVVLLKKTEQTEVAAEKITGMLPPADYQVIIWRELADFYNKTVVLFSKQVAVMKVIIGLIIILTISNTQTMSVMERTTEIGTIMAIGRKRREIIWMFLIEGMIIGLVGGLVGVTLGWALATAISAVGIPMPPAPGMARGYTGYILVNFDLAGEAIVLAIGSTLLASILPAWRASRLVIVNALRTNQ